MVGTPWDEEGKYWTQHHTDALQTQTSVPGKIDDKTGVFLCEMMNDMHFLTQLR